MLKTVSIVVGLLSILVTAQQVSKPAEDAKTPIRSAQDPRLQSTPLPPSSQAGAPEDDAAIREIIGRWDSLWRGADTATALQDYAEDADWMEAFGVYRRGRTEIVRFFAPNGPMHRDTSPSRISIRYVRPDVAVVWSYYETAGQHSVSGQNTYPVRKTHSLRVLTKEKGRWAIISQLIMDEKPRLQ
jgi:uncharacterized protein (TIGR02246 family)